VKQPLRGLATRIAAWAVSSAVAASAAVASGQAIDVERPHTLVVGSPAQGSRVDRVDGARTGRARTTLPTSGLRVEWETSVGALTDQAPLVDSRGDVYVIGTRGEVVMLGRDGAEMWRVVTGGTQPGPAALLSNDTVVFVEIVAGGGSAVGVRDGRVTWRTHVGHADAAPGAPLALDDGGVVVTTAGELAVLDADGHERSRATLTESVATPLLSALGHVVAVTASGAVWMWTPGTDPTRAASFGSPVDGSAALADDHTLLAVTNGRTHLTAVDLTLGTVTTRAVSHGASWCGPPAMNGPVSSFVVVAPGSELAVALDATGHEVSRAVLASHSLPVGADAGAPALFTGAVTPPLVDSSGTLVFATADGRLGVVPRLTTGDGTVELLTSPCPLQLATSGARGADPVAGIAPLSDAGFVATCRSGTLLAVGGARWSGESSPQHL